jgi:hypothetical protein
MIDPRGGDLKVQDIEAMEELQRMRGREVQARLMKSEEEADNS